MILYETLRWDVLDSIYICKYLFFYDIEEFSVYVCKWTCKICILFQFIEVYSYLLIFQLMMVAIVLLAGEIDENA